MCDTGNIDANDEKLINEKMANTQVKGQESLFVVREEENLIEESNLAEVNLDASISLMSSSQNSSNNNVTPDNSQSTSGGREKRIRKKKKLDEDFVSFDSLPSTSNRAFKKDSQEFLEDEEYYYENKDKGTLSQKAQPIYTDRSEVSSEPSAGDLVWAKVCGHPWWPCMITSFPPPININQIELDNDSKDHIKIVGTVKPKKMFCVLFFGPSVEHAWIPDTSFIEYKGNKNLIVLSDLIY